MLTVNLDKNANMFNRNDFIRYTTKKVEKDVLEGEETPTKSENSENKQ